MGEGTLATARSPLPSSTGRGVGHGPAEFTDFDLHGFVGIRLVGAGAADIARVRRQLGLVPAPLSRDPDIVIRFVDRIEPREPLTYAGWADAGHVGDAFVLLRGKGNVPAKAVIPFEAVGSRCEIICERAMPAVPHLLAIVNFTALAKGVLPLHASAFTYEGHGVLATGWAKGGKTETLLAFMALGAHYVGDEWVYLTRDGRMHGVPEPIRLWHWQLGQLPAVTSRLPRRALFKLRTLGAVAAVAGRAAGAARSGGLLASVVRRAAPVLQRQAYLQIPPAELFGEAALALRGRLDTLLLVASHDSPTVTVDRVDPRYVARRMRASLEEERQPFLTHYRQFKYAMPDAASPVVEGASALESDLLEAVMKGHDAYYVRHPYPVDISSLARPVLSVMSVQPPGSPA